MLGLLEAIATSDLFRFRAAGGAQHRRDSVLKGLGLSGFGSGGSAFAIRSAFASEEAPKRLDCDLSLSRLAL